MKKQSFTTYAPKAHSVSFGANCGLTSITNKKLDQTRKYCSRLIENKYDGDYESRTLRAMLGTIIGNFDLLKSKLTNDYNRARNKLKNRQNRKIKKVTKMIKNFEKTVTDHEMALKRYSENIADFNDYSVDDTLHYKNEELQALKLRLTKIEEKNHEA